MPTIKSIAVAAIIAFAVVTLTARVPALRKVAGF
jgi:hypothetical protein